jgi:hypothetical protein
MAGTVRFFSNDTHGALGFDVQPATRTRQLPNSMPLSARARNRAPEELRELKQYVSRTPEQ